jgi:transposase
MVHNVRELLVRQRTMLTGALRGHLAEYGVISARGPDGNAALIAALHCQLSPGRTCMDW